MKVTRRWVARSLGASLVALIALPLAARRKRIAIRRSKVKKLERIGGWTILKIRGKPILLIRESEDKVRALKALCTHKQCLVGYVQESKRIECDCHGSVYSLSGKVLAGPASNDLPIYSVKLTKSRIIITWRN